jgi:hypothetical protein
MNWEEHSCPNSGYYTTTYPPEGLVKAGRNLSQVGRSPVRVLYTGPPEYEAGVLPARLILSSRITKFIFMYHFECPVCIITVSGRAVAYLVEALCYKPEDRGFDSR